jgi:hypothetical protein
MFGFRWRFVLFSGLVLVQTGCPVDHTLELSVSQVKQFEFSWAPVAGAQYYQLYESADVGEAFVQIGGDIVGESVAFTMPLHFRVNARYMLFACGDDACLEAGTVDVAGHLAEAVGYVKASNTGAGDVFGATVALSNDGDTLIVGAPAESSQATGVDGDQGDDSAKDAGAVYVFVRNGAIWSQQAYIKASNTEAGDGFGVTLALSGDGDTLAVGATGEDSSATGINGDQVDNSSSWSGAVYVFVRSEGVWSQQAYLKASNPDAYDEFGSSVALSDDAGTLAVGAPKEESHVRGIDGDQTDNSLWLAGAAYVFVRSGGEWTQQAYVKASNTDLADFFGGTVALSGDGGTLAVGATGEDSGATGINGNPTDESVARSGAAYVFVRSGGVWSQQAYVKASNTGQDDAFGASMALSHDGDSLAVGADWEACLATGINGDQADDSAQGAGAVYVLVRSGEVWSQQAYIKASNTGFHDVFGRRLALSDDGNTLAAGAHGESSAATGIDGDQADLWATFSGAAHVFVRSGDVWSHKAYVKASNTDENDHFGLGVALSGDGSTLGVCAPHERSSATGIGGDQADNSIFGAGAVYLY